MGITPKIKAYVAGLYEYTMMRAYQDARSRVATSLETDDYCLECGAGKGGQFQILQKISNLTAEKYVGIELSPAHLAIAKSKGLQVLQTDLNAALPFAEQSFQCVFGFSVLEHLVNGCRFLQESHRVLKPGGRLVLITPNLSAWFNVFLLAVGRMPSSGPHPDSVDLIQKITPLHFRETNPSQMDDASHLDRHLVVFTYRVLRNYLKAIGFKEIKSRAYGYYPFPRGLQSMLERLDPWHCHQMVFECLR